MNKQDQRLGDGAEAYQAGRDVIINSGLSAEQMGEIMVGLAKQLSLYQAEAMQVVNERLKSFREEILKAFTEPGRGNPEAFREPDFQYVLSEAQIAYARSGDDAVRDTLVDIISRRSRETTRSRIAVTLNDAATKAPLLTTNEFATLSLVYVIRYTRNETVNNFSAFCAYISSSIMPFVKDISREHASYWHLEAQACASTKPLVDQTIIEFWRKESSGLLGRGFDRAQLECHLPDGQKNALDPIICTSIMTGPSCSLTL